MNFLFHFTLIVWQKQSTTCIKAINNVDSRCCQYQSVHFYSYSMHLFRGIGFYGTSCWAVHEGFITTLPWKQNWIFWASVHASKDFDCISTISHHCWQTKSVTISAMILCLSVKRQKQGKFLVALPVANCCDIYLLSQTASQPTRDSIYVISTVNSRETQIKKSSVKRWQYKAKFFRFVNVNSLTAT